MPSAPPASFRAQVENLRPYLLRYATLQLRDTAAAEDAVQEALLKGTPRTASVAYILGQQKRQDRTQATPVDLSRRPDLKDLYVKPHSSETYDALSNPHDDDTDDHD